MLRRLLPFAAILLAGAASPIRPPSIATEPVSRMQTPWWRERFERKQAELAARPIDLVWYGDSITQDWELAGPPPWRDFAPVWQRFYGDRRSIDLGFKGDSTCHLLWRLEHGELSGIHPKVAILLIGANNFGHVHTDAAETFSGIKLILDLMHARLPNTRIVVIGVLPSLRTAWITANTRLLNADLRADLARSAFATFVDASAVLERNGTPDPARFIDPHLSPPEPALHPDAQSQARIAALIEPLVAAGMGDRPHD